jgi:diadenosine tetraphosphatase ApaH/serine/threonine PP2A family protein phosphatase
MHVAVISDIHGNRHALDAVLADVDDRGCDELWCLGDIVGYGADPNGCCATIRRFAAVCLAGNHDLAGVGALSTAEFSADALAATAWTAESLTPENRTWLTQLRPEARVHDVRLAHGSPLHPVWEYLLTVRQATASLEAFDEQVAVVGHSHVALSFSRDGREPVVRADRGHGDDVRFGAQRWILNPGSVGQPRDGDPRAGWMELDVAAGHATWRRVTYDVAGAAAAITAAGLPPSLADRLRDGR